MWAVLALLLCGLLVLPRASWNLHPRAGGCRSQLAGSAFAVGASPTQQRDSRTEQYPQLGVNGFGDRVTVLRSEPPVWLIRDFVDARDCEALMRLGRDERRREVTYSGSVVVFDDALVWPLKFVPLLSAAFQYVFRAGDLAATAAGFVVAALAVAGLQEAVRWFESKVAATGRRGGARFTGKKWQLTPLPESSGEPGDDACQRLLERVQALVGAPSLRNLEPPLLTRYREGEGQSLHIDSHERPGPDASAEDLQRFEAKGGQRIVQCLVYLNGVSERAGGATRFHHPALEDLRVQPEAGSALLFCTAFADGKEDARMSHSAEVVKKCSTAEKWIVPVWRCEGEHAGWRQAVEPSGGAGGRGKHAESVEHDLV